MKLSLGQLKQLIREELIREYDRDEELSKRQKENAEAIATAQKNLAIVAAMLTHLHSTASLQGDASLRDQIEEMHAAAGEIRQGLEALR